MTKKEFMGFSSAAQHDMVLEALVRVTQNLETMEKESGKPFEGTSKQRRNDIKLLTILAEAFGKNELIWDHARVYKNRATIDDGKVMPSDKRVYITTGGTPKNPFGEMMAVNDKIERARRSSGHFMESRDEDKIEGKVLFQRCSGNFNGCVDCKEVTATGPEFKKMEAVNTENKES